MTAAETRVERMPIEEPAEYIGRLLLFRVVPWGREDLGFEMAAPREYVAATGIEPPERLLPGEYQQLCALESVVPPQELINVSVCRPYEVNLADLAVRDIRELGMTPHSIGTVDVGERTLAESESRIGRGDEARAIRSFYYPNGTRVYRVSLILPPEEVASRDLEWDAALQTFRPLAPSADPFREPTEVWRARGPVLLSFRHPARFRAAEVEGLAEGRAAADLTLMQQERPRCRLRLKALQREVADLTPEELIADALQDLPELGAPDLDDQPAETERLHAPAPMFEPRAVYARYTARTADGARREVRVTGMRTKRVGYGLLAVLPEERDDTLGWMWGKRALEIAARTLGRPDEIKPYNLAIEMPERAADDEGEGSAGRQELAALIQPVFRPQDVDPPGER